MTNIQYAKVSKIDSFHNCKRITIVPDKTTKEFASFKAGQYVYLNIDIAGKVVSRPHSIANSPKEAKKQYVFWIKDYPYGFTSRLINHEWKVGTKLSLSFPQGRLCFDKKDKKHVIACCMGNATTPFLSMAWAIADGLEDHDLTVIHSVNYNNDLVFKPELLQIMKKTKRVKLINLVAKEPAPDWLEGIIDQAIIEKAAKGKEFTLLACGSSQFYDYMKDLAIKLKVYPKQYREDYCPYK